MSDILSPPSDGQPPFSNRSKIGQVASTLLIVAGVALLGWGGWLYYQQLLEASKPPPAPIVDSAAVFAATETIADDGLPTPTPEAAVAVAPTDEATVATPTLSPQTDTSPDRLSEAARFATGQDESDNSLEGNPLIADVDALRMMRDLSGQDEFDFFAYLPVEQVESPLTRLVAESIDMDTPVIGIGWTEVDYKGEPLRVWTVADNAAGWHKNSSLPGQGGNIVLSGHHNIKGEVFRYIVDLEIGDTLILYVGEQPFEYVISDKFIVKDRGEPEEVRLANARWIGPFEEERVTLVTCWPYNSNTHRVIVIAKPAVPAPDQLLEKLDIETQIQVEGTQ